MNAYFINPFGQPNFFGKTDGLAEIVDKYVPDSHIFLLAIVTVACSVFNPAML